MIIGQTGCGMRYAVRRSGSAVAFCSLSIKCGTRDEEGFHSGIAHFTEHTIFKGTEHKSASVINGYLDRLGGELNAYTTKEEIVIHSTVLKEDLSKAASLLFELATSATFPSKEIETEKGVVIDEINSYKDSPADEIYDKFEEALFAGHSLGGAILGTAQSVRKITSEELRRFVKKHFTPDRMAFSVVADIDEKRMEKDLRKLAEKFFPGASEEELGAGLGNCATLGSIRGSASVEQGASEEELGAGSGNCATLGSIRGSASAGQGASEEELGAGSGNCATLGSIRGRGPSSDGRGPAEQDVSGASTQLQTNLFDKTIDKHNHEVNAIIGGPAPSLYSKDRIPTVLLANILGGPAANSILNSILREKNGWVYGVECSYTQYRETGIIAISIGCDKENLQKCFAAIDKSISELQDKPMSERRLKAAKKQLLGQLAISSDSGEAQCLSMGKSLLAYGKIAGTEENRKAIDAITAEDIQKCAQTLFAKDKLSRLVFL